MDKFISKKKILSTFLLLTIMLVNSSCVDLEAIRKFTENASVVSQKFPALSSDFYDSCTRQYRYQFYQRVNFNAKLMQEIDDMPNQTNLDGYQTTIPRGGDGLSIIQREVKCREWKKTDKAALLLNKALVDYIKALGELAADDLTNYDKSLNDLGTSITQIGVFEAKHIDAGKGLAKFISSAATNFWRRKKLKSAIEERDKDVSTLAEVLKKYIAAMYVEQLVQERRELDFLYKNTIQAYQNQGGNVNQLTILTVKSKWDAERKELNQKIDSATAYGKILDNVIEGHHKLYESRESLGSKEVKQMILGYAKRIEDLIPTLRKAF